MNRFEYCHPDNNSDNDSFGSFLSKHRIFCSVNLHFMKVSTIIDNNPWYEKITQLVDNIPLTKTFVGLNYNGYIVVILFIFIP
jgi:hypothetical protein